MYWKMVITTTYYFLFKAIWINNQIQENPSLSKEQFTTEDTTEVTSSYFNI